MEYGSEFPENNDECLIAQMTSTSDIHNRQILIEEKAHFSLWEAYPDLA